MKIVMYHYVRPLSRSRFPKIRGRTLEQFEWQLDYFLRSFHVADPAEVIHRIERQQAIPPDWVLLTFDDGYVDHFRYVFPRLLDRKLKAMFFPPAMVVLERELLDVNKIHFILAAGRSESEVYQRLLLEIQSLGYDAGAIQALVERHAQPSRHDTAEVMFIKNVLQKGLPEHQRRQVASSLFAHFVSSDAQGFAEELYLSEEECRAMVNCGMHFGSHGARHYWMGETDEAVQAAEIESSVDFLQRLDANVGNHLTMCYPYGSYNMTTLDLLKKYQFKLGLTTKVGDAQADGEGALELSRYDTLDFPSAWISDGFDQ